MKYRSKLTMAITRSTKAAYELLDLWKIASVSYPFAKEFPNFTATVEESYYAFDNLHKLLIALELICLHIITSLLKCAIKRFGWSFDLEQKSCAL